MAAVLESVAVDLVLDVHLLGGVLLEPSNVDLSVEVANVAENGVVGHLLEVLVGQDVNATSGSDEDLATRSGIFHGHNLVTLHSGLKGVDGVNLGNQDAGSHSGQGLSASLADISITSNDGSLTSNHHISGTLDTVQKGLAATIQVVELGLGDGVVHVDGGELELTLLHTAVQIVHTSGSLLRHTCTMVGRRQEGWGRGRSTSGRKKRENGAKIGLDRSSGLEYQSQIFRQ